MLRSVRTVFVFFLVGLAAHAAHGQKVIGEAAKELADQIAASAAKQQKHKIAVIPFRELDGRTTILGTYLAEELVTALFGAGNLDIVERSMLDKVMSELKLSQSGAIDPESAKNVGKIVGVEAIVTGSITDLQSYVGVNCRLIDTETGRIFGAAQTKIVKDADLQKILNAPAPVSVGTAPGPPAPTAEAPTTQKTPKSPEKNVDGIQIEVVGCRATAGNVVCDLILTNRSDEDRRVILFLDYYRYGVLVDDQSNEYHSNAGKLGTYSANDGNDVENVLVPGVPLKGQMHFSNVPSTVSGIRLLRISAYSGRNSINVDFRDLPLTR
jgi:TolB-like protein